MQLLCSMLHRATIFAACCTLTHSSTFYDKQFDISRENDNWLKVFSEYPKFFRHIILVPGLHVPLSQSSSEFHNKIQWKHTAYLKRSFPHELAILLKFRLLCRMSCRLRRNWLLDHVAIVAKFLDDNKPKTWIRTVSNFIDLSHFHLICQMLVKFSGVEFERTVSKFRKRTRKFLCFVHLLYKAEAWN